MFCYLLLCFAMFYYVLLCFPILLWFCYVLLCFCYGFAMFSYVLLCFAMFCYAFANPMNGLRKKLFENCFFTFSASPSRFRAARAGYIQSWPWRIRICSRNRQNFAFRGQNLGSTFFNILFFNPFRGLFLSVYCRVYHFEIWGQISTTISF